MKDVKSELALIKVLTDITDKVKDSGDDYTPSQFGTFSTTTATYKLSLEYNNLILYVSDGDKHYRIAIVNTYIGNNDRSDIEYKKCMFLFPSSSDIQKLYISDDKYIHPIYEDDYDAKLFQYSTLYTEEESSAAVVYGWYLKNKIPYTYCRYYLNYDFVDNELVNELLLLEIKL